MRPRAVFGGSRRKSPAFARSVSLDETRERDVLARSEVPIFCHNRSDYQKDLPPTPAVKNAFLRSLGRKRNVDLVNLAELTRPWCRGSRLKSLNEVCYRQIS